MFCILDHFFGLEGSPQREGIDHDLFPKVWDPAALQEVQGQPQARHLGFCTWSHTENRGWFNALQQKAVKCGESERGYHNA